MKWLGVVLLGTVLVVAQNRTDNRKNQRPDMNRYVTYFIAVTISTVLQFCRRSYS